MPRDIRSSPERMRRNRRGGLARGKWYIAVAAVVALLGQQYLGDRGGQADVSSAGGSQATAEHLSLPAGIRGGDWVSVTARVKRTLSDDNEGSRHQRFIIELADRRTLLVAHNIDLAERIPLSKGDRLSLRGRYEENERGGVLHWTHHDPQGRHDGGWIEYDGRQYR